MNSADGRSSQFSHRGSSLQRPRWEADLPYSNQGNTPTYDSELHPMSHRSASGGSRGGLNRHPRSWDVRDGRQQAGLGHDYRGDHTGAYREEYQGPRMKSREPYTHEHNEAWEGEHGNSYQQHRGGGGHHEAPQGHYHEDQSSSSGWEEDLQNILPSQVDIHKGTLRFRGTLRGRRSSHAGPLHAWDTQETEDEPKTEAEVFDALDSLREQPWPLHQRRETKKRLKAKLANAEVKWYSTRPVAEAVRKGGNSLSKIFQTSYIWRDVLKRIEGNFGSSVFAFFNFLRAMIQLNLLLGLVMLGGVVIPSVLLAGDSDLQYWGWMAEDDNMTDHDPCTDFSLEYNEKFENCSLTYTNYLKKIVKDHKWRVTELVQDFLQGTGFLEWTILFAGRYPASAGDSSYLVSLAYLLSTLVAYFISFVFVLYFVAKFFRQLPARVRDKSTTTFSSIIFTGWDYTVREAAAANTVHICITGEVKAAFDDLQFLQIKSSRTKRDYVKLILTRAFINILVVALIIGGWVGIYFLVDASQRNINGKSTQKQKFVWEYAPTVAVEVFNFLYPLFFTFVVPYEQYRGHTELLVTLFRCVFVRLTSLIVLMLTKLIVISQESRTCNRTDPYICWETHLGQQIYSILILGAIVQFGMTFVVNVARKALGRINNSLLKRFSEIDFFVPAHVLDVVYLQSICWMSIIHAPILAIVCSFYLCLLFGFKLFTVTYTCVPATRVFRASRSSAMFMTILCLAFLLSLVPNGMALLYLEPSKACSPFRGLDYSWQVLTYYVCKMTDSTYWIRWVVFTLDEAVVVAAMVVVALLLLVYYLSLVNVRNALIRRLEKKLKHTAKDKVFLMEAYEQHKVVAAGR